MRDKKTPPSKPMRTAEEREEYLTSLCYDLVEQRLRDGTASATETTYFLKLASSKEHLELEKLRAEVALNKAKVEALEIEKEQNRLYEKAISAFRSYQGDFGDEENIF